LGEVRQ